MLNSWQDLAWFIFIGTAIVWTLQYRSEVKEIKAFRHGYERGLKDGRSVRVESK